MLTVLIISLVDEIFGMIFQEVNGNLFNIFRPLVAIVFMSYVRGQFINVLIAMRELFFIIFSLFMYVLLFAILGNFYFRESFEGVSYMIGIKETFFELLILMTTANFPDVMLPAYNVHWTRTLFFIIFITLGLYFWLNLILASVFNIFKSRI